MLDAILKFSKTRPSTEPGFSRKTVKWAINCTADGRYLGIVTLGDDGKGITFQYCPNLSQPELIREGILRSQFLSDELSIVALFWKDGLDDKQKKDFCAKHKFFRELIEQAAKVVHNLHGVVALLQDESAIESVRADLARKKAKPDEDVCFRIDGIYTLEQTDWHNWWRDFRQKLRPLSSEPVKKMIDLVTGEAIEPFLTHPKIKGLANFGGKGNDILVGCDKQAFQSYGLEQAANAAMSEEIATAYTEILNWLIREKSIKLGNALVVYWYDKVVELDDDPLPWLKEPPDGQASASAELKAKHLLESIRKGKGHYEDLSKCKYYSLLLSGAPYRVMVREVMHGSFEELVLHIGKWFEDLAIVDAKGIGLAHSPKFIDPSATWARYSVAGSLVRDPKDLPSSLLQHLWRAAITGGKIPYAALAQATLRARVDVINNNPASHARMGLIKAYHLRKGDSHMQPHVNQNHPSPAYHSGRLLAVLADLQRAALGDVGAGVVQRYYTAASQTPGLVVGRLVANAQNHLNKLEGGLACWFENQIADVMTAMDEIPRTLTLEQQSLFALGYYQQLAAHRLGKKEKTTEAEKESSSKTDLLNVSN